jgi:hypothetical protein
VRTTIAVIALGLLGVAGCAYNRSPYGSSTYAGAPAAAAKPNAFVIDSGSSGASPYASHMPQGNPATVIANATPPVPPPSAVTEPVPPPLTATQPTSAPVADAKPPTPVNDAKPPTPVTDTKPPTNPPLNTVHLPDPMPASKLPEPVKPVARPMERPARPSIPDVVGAIHDDPAQSREPAPVRPTPPPIAEPSQVPAPAAPSTKPHREPEQILTGTVESWRRTWRLRYAGVDVEDASGGRVTLIGDHPLDQLQEGQRIRVRGTLIPATDRATAPIFQVRVLEVLD